MSLESLRSQIVVTLAGPVAQRRALRGSSPGWVRYRTLDELIRLHEAGHAIAAMLKSRVVSKIVSGPDGGCVTHSSTASPEPSEQPFNEGWNDRRTAARFAYIATVFCGTAEPRWKTALGLIRESKSEAEKLIDRNWLHVVALANELLKNGGHLSRESLEQFAENLRARVPETRIT